MGAFRARQPGKAIWTAFFIMAMPFRLTFLLIYLIPKSLRQHPKWTYHQAVGSALMRIWFTYASVTEFRTPCSLEPGAEKERFVVMEPVKIDLYLGVLRDTAIQPTTIGGMWYPKAYSSAMDKGAKVVLHFHGGAYVLGGCRPMEGGWGPEVLAKHISGFVFCPQYRLASNPKGQFPAALQDAVTAYEYLLAKGIPPSQIVISGDSAGGNLTVVMLRYLSDHQSLLPNPSAALLWSPWLDLTAPPSAVDSHRNSKYDYIPSSLVEWALRTYKPSGLDTNNPYISPLNNEFSTDVPIFMQCGTAEVLYDEQMSFMEHMKNIPGNRIELLEIANAPHNTFLGGAILGFANEVNHAADVALDFLQGKKP